MQQLLLLLLAYPFKRKTHTYLAKKKQAVSHISNQPVNQAKQPSNPTSQPSESKSKSIRIQDMNIKMVNKPETIARKEKKHCKKIKTVQRKKREKNKKLQVYVHVEFVCKFCCCCCCWFIPHIFIV